MSVLNARMTQMPGQTISPIQKILDSESDACFPEVWKKNTTKGFSNSEQQGTRGQKSGLVNNKVTAISPSWTQTPSGCVHHHLPGSTISSRPSTSL